MQTFLRKIPFFSDLPDEDLSRLCQEAEELSLPEGTELFAEGEAGDRAYVIRRGELEILKTSQGRSMLLAVRREGDVIGEMALLEEVPRSASVRARTDVRLIAIRKEQLDRLLQTSPTALRAMFLTVLGRLRENQALLRQSEKMAQLGTLTAGVAHELNNPAAAVKRSSAQLHEAVDRLQEMQVQLARLPLHEAQTQALAVEAERAHGEDHTPPQLSALERSDREALIEDWLDEHGVEDPWELAPTLVRIGQDVESLEQFAAKLGGDVLPAALGWLDALYTVHDLLYEVSQGAERISNIVGALKSYSYLDQAPVQMVDLHKGLEDTLLLLQHKLGSQVEIVREFDEGLPKIEGYGSELNQVWTNLIDNAVDAMDAQGRLTLRTRMDGDWVVVEIEDTGPGIPPELQQRIFDPFFTTKPPGVGTGLGLDISYRIVAQQHRGDIRLHSEPGKTTFQVLLPERLSE